MSEGLGTAKSPSIIKEGWLLKRGEIYSHLKHIFTVVIDQIFFR